MRPFSALYSGTWKPVFEAGKPMGSWKFLKSWSISFGGGLRGDARRFSNVFKCNLFKDFY